MSHPLSYLTDGDWQALRAHQREIRFERDDIIVREGGQPLGIMVVKSGSARVERLDDGVMIALGHMDAGEVFGEMSLMEDTVASATVTANEPTTVQLFERRQIEALLLSDPGFSARFHRSIALHLSQRLRARSKVFSRIAAQSGPQSGRLHATRLGQITSRQLPRHLVAGIESFQAAMTAVEARPGADAERRVGEATDQLVALLDRCTRPEALFEASYADLGSFRDPSTIASGIGAYVFRRTYSWFMSASTIARAYMKPRGIAEDHETTSMIQDDDPDGDGAVGPLLDRWFLSRPLCRSRREGRTRARALLRRFADEPRPEPVSAAILASGSAMEAIDILTEPTAAILRLVCVDLDHEALARGAHRAQDFSVEKRVAFVHGDVVPRGDDRGAASIGRHDVAYALGLLEYLSDDECVRFLDWAEAALVPGGTLALTTLDAGNPDRLFIEHILAWNVRHRTPDEITALFSRSRFANAPSIEADGTGAGLYAVVTKRAR